MAVLLPTLDTGVFVLVTSFQKRASTPCMKKDGNNRQRRAIDTVLLLIFYWLLAHLWGIFHGLLAVRIFQPIGDIIRQPGSAELLMGGKPPDSKSADIDIYLILEGKKQVGQAIVGEGIRFREYRAVSQDSAL